MRNNFIQTTEEWYTHTRTWDADQWVQGKALITPSKAAADSAHVWQIQVTIHEFDLQPGDHLALELNVGWTLDRGRPFVYGRKTLRSDWKPGYGATPLFVFPTPITYDLNITDEDLARYYIIDMGIREGHLKKGTPFTIYLADPQGSLLRCPKFAQDVSIPVAIRKNHRSIFRRLHTIPTLQVRGGHPKQWHIQTTLEPDHETLYVRAIAGDATNLNPCDYAPDPVVLDSDISLNKKKGYHDAPLWQGQIKTGEPLEILNRKQGLYGKSNPIHPHRTVYFGDLHGQSNRSIGVGSEEEYFWWARDAQLLDFVAPANHYGGREKVTPSTWQYTLDLCDRFDDPDRFVTLYSYEWGGGKDNHRNVYYQQKAGKLFDAHEQAYHTIDQLWQALAQQDLLALTIPHHTKFISRIDWKQYHPQYQRLVEVCSIWGNSEMYGPHSVQTAWMMGHRLGVVGGTDTHFSQPGHSPFGPHDLGGITGILANRLTRKDLWDALYQRSCYATTGAPIQMDFFVDGQKMGSELKNMNDVRKITGQVTGTAPIQWLEIIRNNQVLHRMEPNKDQTTFSIEDAEIFENICLTPQLGNEKFVFYYLRLQQQDQHWAMSSPVWIIE